MRHSDRLRSQLWSFAYLAIRRVLSLVVLTFRTSGSKEIEILVLRHELEILRRNGGRSRSYSNFADAAQLLRDFHGSEVVARDSYRR